MDYSLILFSCFFASGVAVLLFSGDMLTRSSLRAADFLGIHPLTAGLTITAFATSAPEVFVSIQAALDGFTDIALGNVIGSNITNILLVLGLPAIWVALDTDIRHMRRHFLMMMAASLLLLGLAFWGEIGRVTAVFLLLLLVLWTSYAIKKGFVPETEEDDSFMDKRSLPITVFYLILAAGGLWIGAQLTLAGAKGFSKIFDISQAVVALTLLALGTSMPELATSLAALWRRHSDIALGNILGSNVFNILLVLGLAGLITPIPIPNAFLQLDLPVMIGAALLLAPFAWYHRPLRWPIGILFVLCYGLYLWSLFRVRPEIL